MGKVSILENLTTPTMFEITNQDRLEAHRLLLDNTREWYYLTILEKETEAYHKLLETIQEAIQETKEGE